MNAIGRKSAALAIVGIAALVLAGAYAESERATLAKIDRTKGGMRGVTAAVMALWVDDCGGMAPDAAHDVPIRLSTPIAYLKKGEAIDPFGKHGETLLYLPSNYYKNGGLFAIVSRGPDGDLDSARLPKRTEYYKPLFLPKETRLTTTRGEELALGDYNDAVEGEREVVSYRLKSGEVVQNEKVALSMLPAFEKNPYSTEPERIEETKAWILKNGSRDL